MVKDIRYCSIRRVLDDLMEHPMLSDISLEQVVRHAVRFIHKHSYPAMFSEKVAKVAIHEFRGVLPCDLVSVLQVKDMRSHLCLRSMTDNFAPGLGGSHARPPYGEHSFKTQNRVIYTSFPEGEVEVSYQSMPVDNDGFPLLIDNENYLDALEAYIKMKVFGVKFDQGKVAPAIYSEAKQQYGIASRLLESEFTTPSMSEMQSIASLWNTMLPNVMEAYKGFASLGDREYLRRVN